MPGSDHGDGDDSDSGDHRRKRIRQACLNCRRKKVRCGGEKPVCAFCSRLSQPCVYAEDARGRRERYGSDNGDESFADAVTYKLAMLEDRLSDIEGTLRRLEPVLSSLSNLPALLANLNQSVQSQPQTHQPPPHPSFGGDTQLQQNHHQPPQLSNSLACTNANTGLSPTQPDPLPPLNTLLFATDVYFRFCHNQPYSLLHEATFRSRLVAGELPPHLLWAVLAAARRYSSLPGLQLDRPDDALSFAGNAWTTLRLPWNAGAECDRALLPVLQTLVLIVNIEHPAGMCASAYMKLGFALRLVLHSRLHMEPDGDIDPIFKEERKRTFWSLHLQDKLISLSRERFSVLRDDECRIQLPSSEATFRDGVEEPAPTLNQFTGECLDQEAAEKCCPLALVPIMSSTLSRVSHYVLRADQYSSPSSLPWSSASPYAAISSSLLQLEHCFGINEDFTETLSQRCYVDGAIDQSLAGPFIYSKALFHLSHCLLHHPFLLQQRLQKLKQKPPPAFIKSAWRDCRTHARSLTDLKDIKNHHVLVMTSLYGYCTMVAGTIHVLAMCDADQAVREEGKTHYEAARAFLRELAAYWKHAALMASRLERFRLQCEDRPRGDMDPCVEKPGHSPGDIKALWESVDYVVSSAPTRPASPSGVPRQVQQQLQQQQQQQEMAFLESPSRLFDFTDPGTLFSGVDAFSTMPLMENKMLFPDLDGANGGAFDYLANMSATQTLE